MCVCVCWGVYGELDDLTKKDEEKTSGKAWERSKLVVWVKTRLLRPSLSRWNSKECEEGPADVVVVKLVSLPLSPLHLLFVSAVVDVETSAGVRKLVVTLLNNSHYAKLSSATQLLFTALRSPEIHTTLQFHDFHLALNDKAKYIT